MPPFPKLVSRLRYSLPIRVKRDGGNFFPEGK
jgi:hypothetical protein